VLERLEALTSWLDGRDRVGHSRSVLDPVRHVNALLHGGDPAWYRFERERAHNAQLAMLLSFHDSDALPRWAYGEQDAASGKRVETLRISAEAETMPTGEQLALLRELREHLGRVLPTDWSYELTGSIPMYYDMMVALQRYQLFCFGIAGVAIFLLMAIFLGSPRIALLALLPSLLPIAVTLGLLGWWGYGLDPASTMVATFGGGGSTGGGGGPAGGPGGGGGSGRSGGGTVKKLTFNVGGLAMVQIAPAPPTSCSPGTLALVEPGRAMLPYLIAVNLIVGLAWVAARRGGRRR
jgi:hypothetical protein